MSRQQIIDDIKAEAAAEAEKIRVQSEDSLKQRNVSLVSREAKIAADADARIEAQETEIRKRRNRQAEQTEHRIQLELQDRTVQMVTHRVRESIVALAGSDEYAVSLTEWAVEALAGLGLNSGERAVIRCAPESIRIVEKILPNIQKQLAALAADYATLEIEMDETPLPEGTVGIVALDSSGRRAFSNTLDDRVRRSSQDIHRVVITRLFSGSDV